MIDQMSEHEQKANGPETEKFLEWYRSEQQKGLVDIKFCPFGADRATVETFFAEVNRAIASPSVPDSEVF
jgi:hypothetical protein